MKGHTAQLQVDLLGPPEVIVGDHALSFPTRKTLALLIYLAVERGQQPREYLAALLWPEVSSQRSYASLRNTLGHLQNTFSEVDPHHTYLTVAHKTIGINPEADILLDLHTIEHAYLTAKNDRSSRVPLEDADSLPLLQAAAVLHRGGFLQGFSLGDAPAFDDWVTIQQERWHRRVELILDRLSELQFADGDFAGTAETASRWIALDPLSEAAYRRKMRAHFAAGERGQALATYEVCRATLAQELGIEPEPDTETLVARIRNQSTPRRDPPPIAGPDTPIVFLEKQFVGRQAEYQTLLDHYDATVSGQPQVIALIGEAGIGKTSLARKFLNWVEAQDARVLYGRAFDTGTHLLYQPLADAFRPLLAQDHQTALGEANDIAAVSQVLYGQPDIPLDRTWSFEAMFRLIETLAKQSPLALFLDDFQWADTGTLELLQYLLHRWRESRSPILLLLALRSETLRNTAPALQPDLVNWFEQIEREIKPGYLELRPLDRQDSLAFIQSLLLPPDAEFAEWLFDETGGHPFYLKESLKDLIERRALHPKRQSSDRWVFAVDERHDLGAAIRVPSTIRAVIVARLRRLSPNALSLLAAGSILDQRITFERLCAVANLSEDAGLAALDEVTASRLLHEAAASGSIGAYEFANNMIQDVVYTEAGDARRRLFHRRALETLGSMNEPAAVLVHHALAAGMVEAAFQYSLAAGKAALRLSAFNEAEAHFRRAQQLVNDASLPEVETKAAICEAYCSLSQAYKLDGQFEEAERVDDELSDLS